MKTQAVVSALLMALLATACGGAAAQSPLGATPSSDGANVVPTNTTDDSNSALGPTPTAIDGPAPPATDGMTRATKTLPAGDGTASQKSPPVNASGSADSAPDMTDPTKTKN